jgi:hypothetical protein
LTVGTLETHTVPPENFSKLVDRSVGAVASGFLWAGKNHEAEKIRRGKK